MSRKLIIDGNAIYEIDEDCMLKDRVNAEEDKGDKNAEKGKNKEGN